MTGHDVAVPGGHVYHVVLAIPADDGHLGDALWREHLEQAVATLGFGPDPRGRGGCRWVAVHHGTSTAGNDHVHLVLNLVRGDGRIASTYRDWPRWRQWCREVEDRGRLTPTSPAGAGQRATSRAELDRAHRRGQDTDRARLRRRVQQAAAAAGTEVEFLQQLAAAGVRWKPHLTGRRVVGYSVALDPGTGQDPAWWVGGSSLHRSLSLPRLRQRWGPPPAARPLWTDRSDLGPVTTQPDPGGGHRAQQALAEATPAMRALLHGPPDADTWHVLAEQTTRVLTVLDRHDPHSPLRRGHDHLARATPTPRQPGGRPPTRIALPVLAEAAWLTAHSGTLAPLVVATLILTVYGLVQLLANTAERHHIHPAARLAATRSVRTLATHPTVQNPPPTPGPPASTTRSTATRQAGNALQPPQPGPTNHGTSPPPTPPRRTPRPQQPTRPPPDHPPRRGR